MAVNLYDTPAQAKFINTYVPIEFEQLYKMADKAEKDLDQANEFMDKLISESNLNTPSQVDAMNWEKKVKMPITQLAEQAAADPDNLKSRAFQAQIKATTRRIKSDRAVNDMVQNASAMKQFMAKSDTRWGGVENEAVFNYDSSKSGAFTMQNTEFQSGGDMFKQATDQIHPTIRFTPDGKRMIKEVSVDQINTAIENGYQEVAMSPAAKLHWMLAKKTGASENYKVINKDGTTTYDQASYIKDLGKGANLDAIRIESVELTPEYELSMKEASQMRIHRAAKALETTAGEDAAKVFAVDVNNKMNGVAQSRSKYVAEVLDRNIVKYPDGTYKPRKVLSSALSKDEAAAFNAYLKIANDKSKSAEERAFGFEGMRDIVMENFDSQMSSGVRQANKDGSNAYGFSVADWNRVNTIPLIGQNHSEVLAAGFEPETSKVMMSGEEKTMRRLTKANQPVVYDLSTGSTNSSFASSKIQSIMNSDEFNGSMMYEDKNSYTIQGSGVIPNGFAVIPLDKFRARAKDIFGVSGAVTDEKLESYLNKIGGTLEKAQQKDSSGSNITINFDGKTESSYVRIPIKTREIGVFTPSGATVSTNSQSRGTSFYTKK